MAFEKKVPEWGAAGSEPPASLKESGFQSGYKPPAAYFNWFWHDMSEAVDELQKKSALAADNNMKTYTSLTQLGLSGAVTMERVFVTMPDKSVLYLGNTNDASSGNYITDVPNNYGFLELVKHSSSRTSARFTRTDSADAHVYIGKYHVNDGWSGWIKLYSTVSPPTFSEVGAQGLHYYYDPSAFGCTGASTLTEIWNALPDRSVFVFSASNLTDASWNIPDATGMVRIEKCSSKRGDIRFFAKSVGNKDCRMYLDNTTSAPSGVWYADYNTANKPTLAELGATPSAEHNIKHYTAFEQVGIKTGSETVDNITTHLPNNSVLRTNVTKGATANIYPADYGLLEVYRITEYRLAWAFYAKPETAGSPTTKYIGYVFVGDTDKDIFWTGWQKVYTDKNKPTAADVGLGNVPNVKTNDQTPTYSDTTTLATLSSGEKLNVALQKIKCAITNLIDHLNNKSNPHGVTAAQVGAAATSHNHSASNITSGTLPVARGGTGVTSIDTLISNFKLCKIESGSYVGTDADNVSLTLSFSPKVVMLYRDEYHSIMVAPGAVLNEEFWLLSWSNSTVTFSGNTVTFGSTKYKNHNISGRTYGYIAIG